VPTNASVDVGIQKLQDILHLQRSKGRGHEKNNLDFVTNARLESMVCFLQLHKLSGYQDWTMHSETIPMARGKARLKTWL
jgi:hypothetical protein